MEKHKVSGSIHETTEKFTKVSGKAASNMAKASGQVQMVIVISENEMSQKLMAGANILGQTATPMKVNGKPA